MINLIEEELRLIDLFRQKAAYKRFELAMQAIEQRDDERKRHAEIKLRKEEERKLEEAMIATVEQIATFDEHLDEYDTATVHALMDNQLALDLVFKQREEMEAAAFRLPDGRMAFKTEDGKRVFDQHGAELGPETIDANTIPGSATPWERYKQNIEAEANLRHERDQLHDYQRRVDEAREAAGKDDVTADALARMDADLRQTMPDAVRANLPHDSAERAILTVQGIMPPVASRSPAGPAPTLGGP